MKMRSIAFAAGLLCTAVSTTARAEDIRRAVKSDMPGLLELYRHLHKHPEPSNKEVKTAALLEKRMRALGFTVTPGVGGTGLVAIMENGPGPVILIRTDMDALPVTELTDLPYASMEHGFMHACGHDIHMTNWIGVAQQMTQRKAGWSGTLVMIAQPAEETGEGAKAMIDDGLFTRFPLPSAALAIHDWPEQPAGTIGITPGHAWANVDSVDIVVKGIGGHGAYPHNAKDPVVLAARIVTALQTIVSREVDPQDAAVVTVGKIAGGTKRNIIPDEVTLELTVRSYSDEKRSMLLDSIARVARGEAIAAGMPDEKMPEIRPADRYTPATYNSEPLTGDATTLLKARFGERVVQLPATMGGEDFGRYRTAAGKEPIQSLLIRVGAAPRAKWEAAGGDATKLPSLHSAYWAPDPEPTLAASVEAMTAVAISLLKKPESGE